MDFASLKCLQGRQLPNLLHTSSSLFLSPSTSNILLGSLDTKFKESVERSKASYRGESDDEEALFAELEAELENADSEVLRDRGLKEMKARSVS